MEVSLFFFIWKSMAATQVDWSFLGTLSLGLVIYMKKIITRDLARFGKLMEEDIYMIWLFYT